jgi:hypothetical protein
MILAPMRRPMVAPLASLTAAGTAVPISAPKEGQLGNPRRHITKTMRYEINEFAKPMIEFLIEHEL